MLPSRLVGERAGGPLSPKRYFEIEARLPDLDFISTRLSARITLVLILEPESKTYQ